MHSPPNRRSTRRRRSTGDVFRWRNASQLWRRHYLDLGHCRLAKCTQRLEKAKPFQLDELRRNGMSFVAMAVSAASAYGKEADLVAYARTVISCGLDQNDSYNGDTAVSLAAYHGYTELLELLLSSGCSLKSGPNYGHALTAAVRNGQHASLDMILRMRSLEALELIRDELEIKNIFSTLWHAIVKGDVVSVGLLKEYDCALVSDRDIKRAFASSAQMHRLENAVGSLHPEVKNVSQWSRRVHWSFPTSDRETINWLWRAIQQRSAKDLLPQEIWLRVLSFVGRGWWVNNVSK